MGINRKEHPNQQDTEVRGLNRHEFGVKDEEMYQIWVSYFQKRLLGDSSAVEAANEIVKAGLSFNQVCYLFALSMEIITSDYFKDKGGVPIGKPLDLLN